MLPVRKLRCIVMPQIPALRLFLAPNRQILGVQKRGKGGFITQAISNTFTFWSRIDGTRLVFGSWGLVWPFYLTN